MSATRESGPTAGPRPVWRPLAALAAVSAVLWLGAMGAAHWYLVRAVAGLRFRAGGGAVEDSAAGPALVVFGFVLGGVLVAVNLGLAVALVAHRRRRAGPRPAA